MALANDYPAMKDLFIDWKEKQESLNKLKAEVYAVSAEMVPFYVKIVVDGEELPNERMEWLAERRNYLAKEDQEPKLKEQIQDFQECMDVWEYRARLFVPPENDYIKIGDRDDVMCLSYLWEHGAGPDGRPIFCACKGNVGEDQIRIIRKAFNDHIYDNFDPHFLYVLGWEQIAAGAEQGNFRCKPRLANPTEMAQHRFKRPRPRPPQPAGGN